MTWAHLLQENRHGYGSFNKMPEEAVIAAFSDNCITLIRKGAILKMLNKRHLEIYVLSLLLNRNYMDFDSPVDGWVGRNGI